MTSPLENLERLPRLHQPHIWTDYVELLCMVSTDGVISQADVEDRMGERREIEGEIDLGEWTPGGANSPALATSGDRYGRFVADVFAHLAYRASRFDESYPFALTADGRTIYRRRVSNPRRLYSFLLLAANLRYVTSADRVVITTHFERVTASACERWLPRAEVRVFGTNAEPGGRYAGLLRDKIRLLAADLGEEPLVRDEEFSNRDTGDDGLDVVAAFPTGDEEGARLVLFVQATCATEWQSKQHEAGPDRWQGRIRFAANPRSVMVIPFCFRQATGSWHRRLDIENVVLLDRERLTTLLARRARVESVPYPLVERALATREDPF